MPKIHQKYVPLGHLTRSPDPLAAPKVNVSRTNSGGRFDVDALSRAVCFQVSISAYIYIV